MPRGRKKKEKQVEEETESRPFDPETDSYDEVAMPEGMELPPLPLATKQSSLVEESHKLKALREELQKQEDTERREKFLLYGSRIQAEHTKVIEKNRSYILQVNDTLNKNFEVVIERIKYLEEQVELLKK